MSTAKYTPGPWQRSGARRKLGDEDCLQVGPDSFAIAFLPIGRRPMEQAGAIADANLIAASPELLESNVAMTFLVEALLKQLDIDPATTEFDFKLRGETIVKVNAAQFLAKAKAASAKAGGIT